MARVAKTTYVVTDDLDGSELPEDTQPTIFGWDGKQYEIWLSEANHKELEDFLQKFVDEAAEIKQQSSASRTRSSGTAAKPANFFTEIGYERPELEEIWAKMQEDDPKGTEGISMSPARLSNDFKRYVSENISKYK